MRTLTKTLMALSIFGLILTSCANKDANDKNEDKEDKNEKADFGVCDCADMMLAMNKELKEADGKGDLDKMKSIEKKYSADQKKCTKLGEGKSPEEIAKLQEEISKCPSFVEMTKMMGGARE
jgi:hypothetical protein